MSFRKRRLFSVAPSRYIIRRGPFYTCRTNTSVLKREALPLPARLNGRYILRVFSGRLRLFLPFFLLFFLILPLLPAQTPGSGGEADPVSLVGITVDELIRRYGAPRAVYPVRGREEWQDDVVFVYSQGDFYIIKDHVWQVGLKTARGIHAGDSWSTVSTLLGARAERRGNSLFCPLDERAWPMLLRCDFDKDGRVSVIFIYRTDL